MNHPWGWCPSRSAWLKMLRRATEQWSPDPALALNLPRIRDFLVCAIDVGEDWLYHPCIAALIGGSSGRLRKDIQLSMWAASYANSRLGSITIPETLECWAPIGPKAIRRGIHDLSEICYSPVRPRVCLDPYSLSLGEAAGESWGAISPIADEEMVTLKDQIRSFLSAVSTLEASHPACAKWMYQSARVAIPLYPNGEDRSRSWSSRTTPGAVHLDIPENELLILETLVHEAAHCHLYIEEVFGPLIDSADTDAYSSPLRPDPRPLRGILLAYHALAYICAFYSDAVAMGFGDEAFAVGELRRAREKVNQAEQIILDNESHLTDSGRTFARQTGGVARYGITLSQATT